MSTAASANKNVRALRHEHCENLSDRLCRALSPKHALQWSHQRNGQGLEPSGTWQSLRLGNTPLMWRTFFWWTHGLGLRPRNHIHGGVFSGTTHSSSQARSSRNVSSVTQRGRPGWEHGISSTREDPLLAQSTILLPCQHRTRHTQLVCGAKRSDAITMSAQPHVVCCSHTNLPRNKLILKTFREETCDLLTPEKENVRKLNSVREYCIRRTVIYHTFAVTSLIRCEGAIRGRTF